MSENIAHQSIVDELQKIVAGFDDLRSSVVQGEQIVTALHGRFTALDADIREIRNDVKRNLYGLLGIVTSFFVALIGALYFMSQKIDGSTQVLQASIDGARTEVHQVAVDVASMKPEVSRLAGMEGALQDVRVSVATLSGAPQPATRGAKAQARAGS